MSRFSLALVHQCRRGTRTKTASLPTYSRVYHILAYNIYTHTHTHYKNPTTPAHHEHRGHARAQAEPGLRGRVSLWLHQVQRDAVAAPARDQASALQLLCVSPVWLPARLYVYEPPSSRPFPPFRTCHAQKGTSPEQRNKKKEKERRDEEGRQRKEKNNGMSVERGEG